eukprot:1962075-Pyramimonas_sp.AAC.1
MAMGALVVYVGGKKSQPAAPKSVLEGMAERELQRRRRCERRKWWHSRGFFFAVLRRRGQKGAAALA